MTDPRGHNDSMVLFRNTKYPALRVILGDDSVKFVGGRLQADGEQAEALRRRAQDDPRLGIREEKAPGALPTEPPLPQNALGGPTEAVEAPDSSAVVDEPRVPYRALQGRCKALGLTASGSYDTLLARLEEAGR